MATNKIITLNNTSPEYEGLNWPKLIRGILIKRYKRFIADVELDTGEIVTAHCPNSGSMKTCAEPGRPVYLSCHDNPKRKLKYTWELIEMPTSLVGVNTNIPNRLVKLSISQGVINELSGYSSIASEVKTSKSSRLDLMLTDSDRANCYIEIKNSTLVEDGTARFPDAVTARGLKHLKELQALVDKGNRCVMFFLIQRMDAERFSPADDIDPAYGKELRNALRNGVEMLTYDVGIDVERIHLRNKLKIVL